MVAAGFDDYPDLLSHLSAMKILDWKESVESRGDELDALGKSNHYSKWQHGGLTYSLLFLKTWAEDQKHYSVLAHELVHAIQFGMPDFLDPNKEHEACAYQHTYLFDKISKELNRVYAPKRKMAQRASRPKKR